MHQKGVESYMNLAYNRPASIKPYDPRTTEEVAAARKAARHPSRNNTASFRRYNDDGICCYCRTEHKSNHGHGYTIEYTYSGSFLTTAIIYDTGAVSLSQTEDVERWRISQRRQLAEPCDLLTCVLECLSSLCAA